MSEFKNCHPFVNFIYFASVIVFTMLFMHPVCLMISLFCSFAYSIILNGKKAVKFNFLYMIPLLIFSALLNMAFNHRGRTLITYLPGGNALTLESMAYGLAAAAMIVSVICWFSCYNKVMTGDKFIYLFGKIIPSLSLVLSMVFSFVPRFKNQLKNIREGQRGIGRDINEGNITMRIKNGIKIISILITESLEDSIEISDSMKSRGYGLKGRAAFSIFRFDFRDKIMTVIVLIFVVYIITGGLMGKMKFVYFPTLSLMEFSFYNVSLLFSYFALCFLPILIEIRAIRWI